jgi:hypothetical protein
MQGALVDPGEYVARLTVNGKQLTTPVVVEPDAAVALTDADRAGRRGVVTSALALQGKTDPAAARAESAADQLDALSKMVASLPNAPASVKDEVANAAKDGAAIRADLARINRSTLQLFNAVSGSPFRPTATQREELSDLQAEFTRASGKLDALLTTTVPSLDRHLTDAGIPRIIVK